MSIIARSNNISIILYLQFDERLKVKLDGNKVVDLPEDHCSCKPRMPECGANITVENVENGSWKCFQSHSESFFESTDEAKVCIGQELHCNNGARVNCALICIDNSTHQGWYYQVINY